MKWYRSSGLQTTSYSQSNTSNVNALRVSFFQRTIWYRAGKAPKARIAIGIDVLLIAV